MTCCSPASPARPASSILLALAGVAVFLTVEGFPAFTASESALSGASSFLGYVWPLVFGTMLAATLALLIATPLAIGVAMVIAFYAPRGSRARWAT